MAFLSTIHGVFGEMILPVLILAAAIYLTAIYRADAPRGPVARIFPVLVDLQVTLGIILWIYLLFTTSGDTQARYFSFPFILHPILGILAAGLAHAAVGPRNPLRNLGRWAPLASLAVLLVLVVSNVFLARQG
jgi:Na+-transporting NADH:ubiquinone oxidoreductase subunit NqrB